MGSQTQVSGRPALRLIAATRNPAKVHEFQRVVGELAVIEPLPNDISPEGDEGRLEDADSAAAIAARKAVAWSHVAGIDRLVIASDGGLQVPGLGPTWNATLTRRFAGDGATDLERARRLLNLASSLNGKRREISWTEAIAVARNGETIFTASASGADGILADGLDPEVVDAAAGFWVSAVWRCPEHGARLLAELTPEEREARDDHWHRLGEMLRPRLVEWYEASGDPQAFVE